MTAAEAPNRVGDKKPFLAACLHCGHVWAAIWLPAPVKAMSPARFKSCPMCHETGVYVGTTKDWPAYRSALVAELARLDAEMAARPSGNGT
jgi:hypothetical protein